MSFYLIHVEQQRKQRYSTKASGEPAVNASSIKNLLRNEGIAPEDDDEVGGRTVLIGELDV